MRWSSTGGSDLGGAWRAWQRAGVDVGVAPGLTLERDRAGPGVTAGVLLRADDFPRCVAGVLLCAGVPPRAADVLLLRETDLRRAVGGVRLRADVAPRPAAGVVEVLARAGVSPRMLAPLIRRTCAAPRAVEGLLRRPGAAPRVEAGVLATPAPRIGDAKASVLERAAEAEVRWSSTGGSDLGGAWRASQRAGVDVGVAPGTTALHTTGAVSTKAVIAPSSVATASLNSLRCKNRYHIPSPGNVPR